MKKKCLAMLLAVVLAVSLLPGTAWAVDASGKCGEDVTWSYSDGVLTIQGTGPMEDYTGWKPWQRYCTQQIHTIVIGDGVTRIGDQAFIECQALTSVTIPDSVTSIGKEAFRNCRSLTEVTIPDSVTTIGEKAFMLCNSLTSVTIPSSVTTIETGAFRECESLTSINVASGNPAYSSVDGVLFGAAQTLLHAYPMGKSASSYDIPDSVTAIGAFAFDYCTNLTDVTIPDNVTTIGQNAFQRCESLTSVTIPSGIAVVGVQAFYCCYSLTDVYYGGSERQWDQFFVYHGNSSLLNANIHCAVTDPPPSFTDVPEGQYFTIPVAWAVENGITAGTTNTTFSPNDLCTNLQILTFLWRAEGKPAARHQAPITVPAAYQRAVDWAYDMEILNGYTTFVPGAYCTRADAVKYIWQARGSHHAAISSRFTDVSAGMSYGVVEAVSWATENGITNGYPDGTFRPGITCSRAEIVTLLHRAYVEDARLK